MSDDLEVRQRTSLRNVLALALRIRRRAKSGDYTSEHAEVDAQFMIRFCKEAGIEPNIIRTKPDASDDGGVE